ncbi:MAG: hypothetical protein ACREPB_05170 [Arenimonas sp.]
MNNWPFADPRNVAAFTVRQIMSKEQPILLVVHDNDDGTWQFLTGSFLETADFMLVSLEEIVRVDHTVSELADLPLGWQTSRMAIGQPWSRFVSNNG